MLIDIIFLILMIMAVFKGFRKGFIIAIFSVVGLIIGLMAAVKLSVIAAGYLSDSTSISARWLPVISFAAVFLIAFLLVQLGARAIEKMVELAMLGWVNRLAGVLVYIFLYTVILSIILFYAAKINVVSAETVTNSKTYPYISGVGPKAINGIGKVLPVFKGMFHQLGEFFDNIKNKAS